MKKIFKCMALSIMLLSFTSVVKAEVISYTTDFSGKSVQNSMYTDFKINDGPMGYGTGNIIGTFMSYALNGGWDFIRSIAVLDTNGNEFVCNIGTYVIDGNNQQIGSFTCPVDTAHKLTKIRFRKGDTSTMIQILLGSQRVSFVQSETYAIINGLIGKDYTDLLEQFKSSTDGHLIDIYHIIDSKTSDILNAITTNNSNLTNGLNDINDSVKEGNKIQQDTNNTIKDGSVDSGGITALTETKLPTSGVFSAILNLPVQFFQSLLDNLSTSTCKNIEFPLPFVDQNVSIPCVRKLLEQLNALQFYETIGLLVGGIAIFNYLMYMGKQFTKMELLQHTNAEFGGL